MCPTEAEILPLPPAVFKVHSFVFGFSFKFVKLCVKTPLVPDFL